MNASWMALTEPPTPTFSPSFVHGPPIWLGRFMLWEIPPAAAIFADQVRPMATRPPYDAREFSPWLTRSSLVRARNWASSDPGSAWAAVASAVDSAGVKSAMPSSRPNVLVSSRRPLAMQSPFGSPAAVESALKQAPCRPVTLRPRVPRDCPFRGHLRYRRTNHTP